MGAVERLLKQAGAASATRKGMETEHRLDPHMLALTASLFASGRGGVTCHAACPPAEGSGDDTPSAPGKLWCGHIWRASVGKSRRESWDGLCISCPRMAKYKDKQDEAGYVAVVHSLLRGLRTTAVQ